MGAKSIALMRFEFRVTRVRFGNKVMFSGPYWSLEVIEKSFRGHLVTRNSNLISAIDSASTKTYEKTYNMPQSEIWLERYVTGHYWSLEVI